MLVVSFDLSSSCIGVLLTRIEDGKIIKCDSCPVVPSNSSNIRERFGFMSSKKRLPTRSGKLINTWWRKGEESISQTEKNKRDREVREYVNNCILSDISFKLGAIINTTNPDLILVEKNAAFNGILTTKLLAEVMGILVGISGNASIPVIKYPVNQVRSILDVSKLTTILRDELSEEEMMSLPDVTKRAIGNHLSKIYNINFSTDDESDACAVFHYWWTQDYKGEC
ncbi:MAG: hypothetical protein RR420_01115 [Anaerovoracaceae bacterium]